MACTLTNMCLYSYLKSDVLHCIITVQTHISKCISNSITFFLNYLATVEHIRVTGHL